MSVLLILLLALLLVQALAQVKISGRQIRINSKPFFARGAAYSPVPVPQNPGAVDLLSNANSGIWSADLNALKAMGGNTIRIYSDLNGAGPYTSFLNALVTQGIYVILNYWVTGDITTQAVISQSKTGFSSMVNRYKGHPAVLAFALGNELDNAGFSPAQLQSFLQQVFSNARQNDTSGTPYTTTLADNSNLAGYITASDSVVDIWCVQIYRGCTFSNLFSQVSAVTAKPFIITEFGIDAFNHVTNQEDDTTHSNCVTSLVVEIEQNSVWNVNNPGVVSGGLVFEWCDEWWKYIDPTTHNSGGNAASSSPDGWADPEYYGMYAIGPGTPNTRTARPLYSSLQKMFTTCAYPYTFKPDNQILNAGFDLAGLQDWQQVAYGGASFSWSAASQYMAVTNIVAGPNGYNAQIQYLNLAFKAGTTYTYSFSAATLDGSTRTLFHYLETSWPPLSGNGNPYTTTITGNWQTFTFTFVSTQTSTSAHLAFEIGNAPTNPFGLDNFYISGGQVKDTTLSQCPSGTSPACQQWIGEDYYGGDVSNVPAASASACCNDCLAASTWCKAWSFAGGICYLKNQVNTQQSAAGVTTGIVVPAFLQRTESVYRRKASRGDLNVLAPNSP